MATSTISNVITDPSGTAVASVTVVAKLMPGPGFRTSDSSEIARRVTTTSNGSGAWSLSLEQQSNISPTSSWWEIEEQIPEASGGPRVWAISVGSGAASLLASLVTPAQNPALAAYLTQAAADARYQAIGAGASNLRYLSAADYGVTGDATTDDTTALNQFFAAAAGKVGVIPPGFNVRVTASATPAAGSTILAYGATVTIDKSASDVRGIYIGTDDVSIFGLTVTSASGQETSRGHQGICLMNGANRGTIAFCHTYNLGQYGIICGDTGTNSGATGHKILHNFVDMTNAKAAANPAGIIIFPKGGAGFLADPGVEIIGNNVVLGSTPLDGIKINAQRGARIAQNRVTGGTSASFEGSINIFSSKDVTATGNTVRNTRFGITVAGQAGVDNALRNQNITVVANVVTGIDRGSGSSAAGVYASDGSSAYKIADNIFDVEAGNTATACIYLQPASSGAAFADLHITGNTLVRGPKGIYILADSGAGTLSAPNAVISNNVCVLQDGQAIQVTGDDITCENNKVLSCGLFAIQVTGDRTQFLGNVVTDANTSDTAGQMGINAVGSNCFVSGNVFINGSGGGHLKYGAAVGGGGTGNVLGFNHYVGMDTANTNGTFSCPGFFGAAAFTKPAVTGSRGGNAALASLLTALATAGLITDSSS